MKKYFTLLFCALVSFSYVSGQEATESNEPLNQSLFKKKINEPTFGYLDLGYAQTTLQGRTLPGFDMELGFVFNDWFTTGVFMHYTGSSHLTMNRPLSVDVVNPRYNYYFTGINTGIILFPRSTFNITIPLRTGMGIVTLTDRYFQGENTNARIDQDYFFAFEPGIRVHVNLFEQLAIGGGASYRIAAGVDNAGSNADFQQAVFSVGLRFRFQ